MIEKGRDHQTLPPGFDLTSKQRAFAHAYLETGGNGRKAAQRAYNCSSPESASVLACKALKNPKVLTYLDYHFSGHDMPDAVVESLKGSLSATKIIKVGGRKFPITQLGARPSIKSPRSWISIRTPKMKPLQNPFLKMTTG